MVHCRFQADWRPWPWDPRPRSRDAHDVGRNTPPRSCPPRSLASDADDSSFLLSWISCSCVILSSCRRAICSCSLTAHFSFLTAACHSFSLTNSASRSPISVTPSRLLSSSVVTYLNWGRISSPGVNPFDVTGAAGSDLGVNGPNAPPWPLAPGSINSACDTNRPPWPAPCSLRLTILVLRSYSPIRLSSFPFESNTTLPVSFSWIYEFTNFEDKCRNVLSVWSQGRNGEKPASRVHQWCRRVHGNDTRDPYVPCCLATITHFVRQNITIHNHQSNCRKLHLLRPLHGHDCFTVSTLCRYTDIGSQGLRLTSLLSILQHIDGIFIQFSSTHNSRPSTLQSTFSNRLIAFHSMWIFDFHYYILVISVGVILQIIIVMILSPYLPTRASGEEATYARGLVVLN